MDNNSFTEDQLKYIYSDEGFLLFLSSYFSTYNVKEITLNADIAHDINDEFWKIYIRILLANIKEVITAIEKVEKNISFSYEEKEVKISGGIKGRLVINEYVKNKSMIRMPKEYPCITKEKSYATVENEYLAYVVNDIVKRLQELINIIINTNIVKGQETEIKLLRADLDYFKSIIRKQPFKAMISPNLIRETQNGFDLNKVKLIQTRFKKGKIRNAFAYKRVFNWYEHFKNRGLTWIDSSNLKYLVYDDSFCNKLFEVWNLYRLAEVFQNDFDMEFVSSNLLVPGMKDYVYKLKSIDGSFIEIYYQKGSKLYWDTDIKQNWHYKTDNGSRELIGIPDISVKHVGDSENITIIDLKNRVRRAGENSEEIYKMIGYFSNFSEYMSQAYNSAYKNQAILIFRNDFEQFEEYLESETGERILSISTGLVEESTLNSVQFHTICRYVLDVQGMTGTKSETISSCSKSISQYKDDLETALQSGDENEVENITHEIEKRNHSIITSMFSLGDLQDTLTIKKEELRINHFPHIWDSISPKAVDALAMADSLFSGLSPSITGDYAPVCLEYCRAVEIQLNELIFIPFKESVDLEKLSKSNWNYNKLTNDRDLTLGECIFLLEKCRSKRFQTIDLLKYIEEHIHNHDALLDIGVNILRWLNIDVRRKAAHTTIMSYDELLDARQRVLGIGHLNILYQLLDNRSN
ncbi:MAG: hypothetical protein KMY55_16780 [Dethiosulfatibacter sp.]|nr:hypothetical protein [Dethiosulfatibacter sp.]